MSHTPPLTIRTATVDDAPAWSDFARRVFLDTFGPNNNPDDLAEYMRDAFTHEQQRGELEDPNNTCLLVECDDALAGYTLLRPGGYGKSDEPTDERLVRAARPLEIQRFYVDHAFHGRGIAQQMMMAALDHAASHSADVVWLGVWEHNPRAIRFYEKCGFFKAGAHRFRLGRDVQRDHVMMRRL
ncbi:MAG TPA: GNAT family N-acetyltransferase [Gemmatimonas sp.]|uniref:GNAT family N-acetyltransferase n=1 Tax=Gemmatimonas sp. TaxID=1962908 RepID=UPI002ED907D6